MEQFYSLVALKLLLRDHEIDSSIKLQRLNILSPQKDTLECFALIKALINNELLIIDNINNSNVSFDDVKADALEESNNRLNDYNNMLAGLKKINSSIV